METNQDNNESLFAGDYVGLTTLIKTFHCDTHLSFVSASSEVPGYYFTLHSLKRELWSLQSKQGVLVGIGNVFNVEQYEEHLKTYPRQVRLLLLVEFGKNSFKCTEPLMFMVNNTMRLIPTKNGLFHLITPDNSVQVMTNPYVKPSTFSTSFLKQFVTNLGERMDIWLKAQFQFITGKRKMFSNATRQNAGTGN